MFNHTMRPYASSLYCVRQGSDFDGVYIVPYRFLECGNPLGGDRRIIARICTKPLFGRDALRREKRARGLRIRRLRETKLKERDSVRVQQPRIVRKLRKATRSGT